MDRKKSFFSKHRYLQFFLVLAGVSIAYALVCVTLYHFNKMPTMFQWESYSNSVLTTVSILVGFSAASFGIFFGISNQDVLQRIVGNPRPKREILFTLFIPVVIGIITIGCAMLVQIIGTGEDKIAIEWLIGLTWIFLLFLASFVFATWRTFMIICAAIAKKT